MKLHNLKNKFFLFLPLILFLSCNSNKLSNSDYEILQLIISQSITVNNLENDIALKNISDSSQYYKKYFDMIDKQNYESTYYYTLDDSLFSYKQNRFIKGLFLEYGFDRDIPNNMTSQKFDFSKIKTKKNLVRINKTSPLITSKNYIGDFKVSRILYDGDKAAVILVEKGDIKTYKNEGRHMFFFNKENNEWKFHTGQTIPFKYYDEKIEL